MAFQKPVYLLMLFVMFISTVAGSQAFYRFDGSSSTVSDSSANSNALELSSSAISFDGENDYMLGELPDSVAGNESWTVSFWMKYQSTSYRQWVSVIGTEQKNNASHWLIKSGNQAQFGFWSSTQNDFSLDSYEDEWAHVTTVYNKPNSKLKTYVNGDLKDENTVNEDPHLKDGKVSIGSGIYGGRNKFEGQIGDFKLYSAPLSSREVEDLYRYSVVSEKPLLHWPMEEGFGKITDVSGNYTGRFFSTDSSLVYNFEDIEADKVEDRSSNQNTGQLRNILTGSVNGTQRVTGRRGRALDFDGSTSDKVVLSGDSLDGLESFSISLWIKTSKSGTQGIVSGANSNTDNALVFYLYDDNRLRTYLNNNQNTYATPSLEDGSWHHLGWVRNSSENQEYLYVDGDLMDVRTPGSSNPLNISTDGLMLGQEQDSVGGGLTSGQAFDGKIDEVKFFNGTLTSSEISLLYERSPDNPGNSTSMSVTMDYRNSTHLFDTSFYENHAEASAGSSTSLNKSECVVGRCQNFDQGDFYELDDRPSLSTEKGYTVMSWVYADSASAGEEERRVFRHFGGDSLFQIWSDDKMHFYQSVEGDLYAVSHSWDFPHEEWHHVAMSSYYNKSSNQTVLKSFLDGELKATRTAAGKPDGASDRPYISSSFDGRLDEVKYFRESLNSSEISNVIRLNGTDRVHRGMPEKTLDLGFDRPNGSTAYSHANIVSGVNGRSLEFNGYNDAVDVPDSGSLKFGDEITVSAWLNLDSYDSNKEPGRGSHHIYKSGSFGMVTNNNDIHGWITDNGSRRNVFGNNWPRNEWFHTAITFNGSVVKIYQNGNLTGERTYIGDISNSTNTLRIGNAGGFNWGTDGRLDEIKIIRKSLNQSQIKHLYRGQKASIAQSTGSTPMTGRTGQEGLFSSSSYRFDNSGTSGEVEDMFNPSENFSISLWARKNSEWGRGNGFLWKSSEGRLFLKEDSREIFGDGLVFGYRRDGKYRLLSPVYSLEKGKWHHIVAGYSPEKGLSLKVDGNSVDSEPSISENISGSAIGFEGSQFLGEDWNGNIDEVRIFNRSNAESVFN
ncbi:LamG-like jellyroll fold domain-containing protein [Candidatus Nanohalovita haloferacivicina]|uniref:LamG-like jellyroll fold domain-containing protein n=1 Tax=Candidatus Nanohalovita haloferacivicina TaxID=2978046 RepID=UPI00325FA08F